MTTAAEPAQRSVPADDRGPDEVGHTHADVSGGWLRAADFGAMDGLVTNVSLVAGIGAAGVRPEIVVTAGLAGLVAGAFSMALGEYASVSTQNEAVDKEVATERREIRDNPEAELSELTGMFEEMGMSAATAGRRRARCTATTRWRCGCTSARSSASTPRSTRARWSPPCRRS